MNEIQPQVARVEADPKRPWKAWAGAAVALLGLLWANLEGRDSLSNMTAMEWLSIVVPAVITWGTIYFVRNPLVSKDVR